MHHRSGCIVHSLIVVAGTALGLQSTHTTDITWTGTGLDVAHKEFGYHEGPSLNGRLRSFRLRPALERYRLGRCFIMLIERGKDDAFSGCVEDEQVQFVCVCGAAGLETVHVYTSRPAGETEFTFTLGRPYYRELVRCPRCGHFRSVTEIEPGVLYGGAYVTDTYGDGDDGIRAAFERITGLDSRRSDNAGRVRRINELAEAHLPPGTARRLLDVGTGLGVFPHAMKAAGWSCTAIDPDPRAARHVEEIVGVDAVCDDFLDVAVADVGRFDLVTLNKVLEHVVDPVAMLDHAREFIGTDGLVYVEVPDGTEAFADDPDREEFFIDHLHVFSVSSTSHLAKRAGFRPLLIERLREPSRKYTIRALLRPTA